MMAVPNFVPGCGNAWHWVWNSKENYLLPLHETLLACQTQRAARRKTPADEEARKSPVSLFHREHIPNNC